MIKLCLSIGQRCKRNQGYDVTDDNNANDDDIAHERIEDPEIEPLINYAPQPASMLLLYKYTETATSHDQHLALFFLYMTLCDSTNPSVQIFLLLLAIRKFCTAR